MVRKKVPRPLIFKESKNATHPGFFCPLGNLTSPIEVCLLSGVVPSCGGEATHRLCSLCVDVKARVAFLIGGSASARLPRAHGSVQHHVAREL